jgi:hypothetical protein
VNNLNLEIFIYLPNILVTVELYGLRVSINIKEHEKDRRAFAPPVFSLKLRPCYCQINGSTQIVYDLYKRLLIQKKVLSYSCKSDTDTTSITNFLKKIHYSWCYRLVISSNGMSTLRLNWGARNLVTQYCFVSVRMESSCFLFLHLNEYIQWYPVLFSLKRHPTNKCAETIFFFFVNFKWVRFRCRLSSLNQT